MLWKKQANDRVQSVEIQNGLHRQTGIWVGLHFRPALPHLVASRQSAHGCARPFRIDRLVPATKPSMIREAKFITSASMEGKTRFDDAGMRVGFDPSRCVAEIETKIGQLC